MSHAGMKNDGSYKPSATTGIDKIKYPAGEPQLSISDDQLWRISKLGSFDARSLGAGYCDLTLLSQASDIIRYKFKSEPFGLYLPYMPFSRQDRRIHGNTAHSLKAFANAINAMEYDFVITVDPHSDVCEAVFDDLRIIEHDEVVETALNKLKSEGLRAITFLSPDAGAAKKLPDQIRRLELTDLEYDIDYAQKHRDVLTGDITHTSVPQGLDGGTIMIVDDICDGGRTFIEIAKALPADTEKHLVVTHGIFSKGTDILLEHFETITTTDSFAQSDSRLNVIGV